MCSIATTQTETMTQSENSRDGTLSPNCITQISSLDGGRTKRSQATASDDELESLQTQHCNAKTDRQPLTKPEEDHRRRTIIVEKRNGSYGFTLQSYGIHYKKVQEVEMITYVDYVEYDGPAYKAGMREGDVILSINGTDMEKSDHKTLVQFIKECDSYMRMVVLFEDCVRKVGLHMKYIQLQNVLQVKMSELEKVCIKENKLLQGKWKTHSLPARKKTTTSSTENNNETVSSSETEKPLQYNRSTLSTEDVNAANKKNNIIPPPAQFMLAYHYFDPNCQYILRPSASSSTEYIVSVGHPTRSRSEYQHFFQRVPSTENTISYTTSQQQSPKNTSASKSSSQTQLHQQLDPKDNKSKNLHEQHGNIKNSGQTHAHFCNPCIKHSNKEKKANRNVEKDNVSLDAYDLASPCCEPHCIPTKRKSRHHKEHHHRHKHRENRERPQRPKSQSYIPSTPPLNHQFDHKEKFINRPKHFEMNPGIASHCSLHSCTSSEMGGTADKSATSYTTSLSTDTLYWEPHSETSISSRPPINKLGIQKINYQPQFIHRYYPHTAQIQPAPPQGYNPHYVQKPKSWDNLTTKSFGGYGFGYGYLDTVAPKQPITAKIPQPTPTAFRHSMQKKNSYARCSAYSDVENYAPPPSQFIQKITTTTTTITTKSTENLIGAAYSDSSIICDCLEAPKDILGNICSKPSTPTSNKTELVANDRIGYYSNLSVSKRNLNNQNILLPNCRNVSTTSEITRL